MKSTFEDEQVTVVFTRQEYNNFLLYLGVFLGTVTDDKELFYGIIRFANKMNEGNPLWRHYEIKEIPNEKTSANEEE